MDAEIGVILRLASRLRGEEYNVLEILDTAFDEEFAEGAFLLKLTGVEFKLVDTEGE